MCVRFCEFWTYRIILFAISIVSVVFSFLLGPLHTMLFITGVRTDLNDYFKNEYEYAILLCLLLTFAWITFVSNSVLFVGCFSKSRCLLDLFAVLTIVNMVFAFGVAFRYLIFCAFIDTYCFDHSTGRKTTDGGAAFGLFCAVLLYLLVCVVILFMACSYKLALRSNAFYL